MRSISPACSDRMAADRRATSIARQREPRTARAGLRRHGQRASARPAILLQSFDVGRLTGFRTTSCACSSSAGLIIVLGLGLGAALSPAPAPAPADGAAGQSADPDGISACAMAVGHVVADALDRPEQSLDLRPSCRWRCRRACRSRCPGSRSAGARRGPSSRIGRLAPLHHLQRRSGPRLCGRAETKAQNDDQRPADDERAQDDGAKSGQHLGVEADKQDLAGR